MKKILSLLITAVMLFSLCACEAIFIEPPENKLTEEDFTFFNLESNTDVTIGLNQAFVINADSGYYKNLDKGDDITINIPFSLNRGVAPGNQLSEMIKAFEVEPQYAGWNIFYTNDEGNAENAKEVYNSIDDTDAFFTNYSENLNTVFFIIGYYKEGKKWLSMTGEDILKLLDGECDIDSNEFYVISADIGSAFETEEIYVYCADKEYIVKCF